MNAPALADAMWLGENHPNRGAGMIVASTQIPTGRRIGSWRIIAVDAVGKRATSQCSRCGTVHMVAVADLANAPCDCRPLSLKQRKQIKQVEQQLHTRRAFDWRPGR